MDNLKSTIAVIGGSVLLIIGIVWFASMVEKPDQFDVSKTVGEGANTAGLDGSKIIIVGFSDFLCPACRATAPEIERFASDYSDQVEFMFRHFPLPQYVNSRYASYAAEAGREQDKFQEVHNWLFDNQSVWKDADVTAEFFYEKISEEIELDRDRFVDDYRSDTIRERVARDVSDAKGLGVNSTPTFFINGEKTPGALKYDDFVRLTGVEPMPESEPTAIDEIGNEQESEPQ